MSKCNCGKEWEICSCLDQQLDNVKKELNATADYIASNNVININHNIAQDQTLNEDYGTGN